jgi:hypothetical protein
VFGAQVTPPLVVKVPKYSASSFGVVFVPPEPITPLSLRAS